MQPNIDLKSNSSITPDDNILEISCGAGLLAVLIADHLKEGKLLAIDKSIQMSGKARKRNKRYIESDIRHIFGTFLSSSSLARSVCYLVRHRD